MTSTREHLRTVHHMPGLLYAGLDPEAVHWQAHMTAARAVLDGRFERVMGTASYEAVAMLAAASIEEETR